MTDHPYNSHGRHVHLDIHAVARTLGGNVIGRDRAQCPGPGHSPSDRSLVVKLDPYAPGGFVCFSHAGDAWDVCKDYVRARLGLPPRYDRHLPSSWLLRHTSTNAGTTAKNKHHEHTQDERSRIERAREVWHRAVDPRGTLAERYLRSRALELDGEIAVSALRFHPQCPWDDARAPALVAAFRSIDDDQITAVQRVALDGDGKKIGRRMLGVVSRSAVKLTAAGETLHIGEGVETCLAARQLGYAPAWAAGSATAIESFPVIDGVRTLRILGEACAASEQAIKLCGQRWHAAGRRVQFVMPNVGKDLNDQLMKAAP